jgi:hypothetical protein
MASRVFLHDVRKPLTAKPAAATYDIRHEVRPRSGFDWVKSRRAHRRFSQRQALMDMHVAPTLHRVGAYYPIAGTEYARLAEHREQVFALIGQFRQAVAQPRGRRDAIRSLKGLIACSDAYFAIVESVLDKISGTGAAPQRVDHRRILGELKSTLDRCSSSSAQSTTIDLVHALDTLVMHEATICVRASENSSAPR